VILKNLATYEVRTIDMEHFNEGDGVNSCVELIEWSMKDATMVSPDVAIQFIHGVID
jgi:hypothetical protein